MRRNICFAMLSLFIFTVGVSLGVHPLKAQNSGLKQISLPAPATVGGNPLMQCLKERKANRTISRDMEVSEQDLSNLLWAAWGVNREDGRRTVPTAMNKQEMELYVAMKSGVWHYVAKDNSLVKVLDADLTGKFSGAPVTVLYAATTENRFSGMHVGSSYQNVGLYCASAGLANVVKASGVDEANKQLPLPKGYEVLILQSLGWPK